MAESGRSLKFCYAIYNSRLLDAKRTLNAHSTRIVLRNLKCAWLDKLTGGEDLPQNAPNLDNDSLIVGVKRSR